MIAAAFTIATAAATCSADTASPSLTLPGALQPADIAQIFVAERSAWRDSFLVEHDLANHTRQITESRVHQSVTWLHRHRGDAGGVIERLEASALAAAAEAGWKLDVLGELHVRCVESIRYVVDAVADTSAPDAASEVEGWHQDEYSVLTAVATLSTTAELRGGEIEVDRGGGAARASGSFAGDLVLFRSWDAHRSTPMVRGARHILVLEWWQGPPTLADAKVGRPAERALPPAIRDARFCASALAADSISAALLWFCAKAEGASAAGWLQRAAAVVGENAYLWELAAASLAVATLDELGSAPEAPSLRGLTVALQRAGTLRTAARVPDEYATLPAGWDEDEDGPWEAGLVDGPDGGGGFFRQMSIAHGGCGFPTEGLQVLRRVLAMRGVSGEGLGAAVRSHPSLREGWAR